MNWLSNEEISVNRRASIARSILSRDTLAKYHAETAAVAVNFLSNADIHIDMFQGIARGILSRDTLAKYHTAANAVAPSHCWKYVTEERLRIQQQRQ